MKKNLDTFMKWKSHPPLHLPGNKFLIHSKSLNWSWGNAGKSTMLCMRAVFVCALYVQTANSITQISLCSCCWRLLSSKVQHGPQSRSIGRLCRQLLFMLLGNDKNALTDKNIGNIHFTRVFVAEQENNLPPLAITVMRICCKAGLAKT